MDNNKFCSICGKEKESNYIEFAKKTFYKECECERKLRLKKEKEDRERAINIYVAKRTKKSGVLKREESALFSNLIVDEHNKKAIDGAKYITALMLKCDNCQGKNGLILSGNRGSGKTYIAASVINEYNRNEKFKENVISDIIKARENGFGDDLGYDISSNCRFIKEKDVIQLYERYSYKEKTPPIDEFKKAKILVVDDLGSSYCDSKKLMSILFDFFPFSPSYSNITKKRFVNPPFSAIFLMRLIVSFDCSITLGFFSFRF